MVFTEASASPRSPQALGIHVPPSGAVHRKQKCHQRAQGLVKKQFVQRQKARSDGPVTCAVADGQGDEQD